MVWNPGAQKIHGHILVDNRKLVRFAARPASNPPAVDSCCAKADFWDFEFSDGSCIPPLKNVQQNENTGDALAFLKSHHLPDSNAWLEFDPVKVKVDRDAIKHVQKYHPGTSNMSLPVDDLIVAIGQVKIFFPSEEDDSLEQSTDGEVGIHEGLEE